MFHLYISFYVFAWLLFSLIRTFHLYSVFMEKICEDCFHENVYLRELYEQSAYTKTSVGRALHSLGNVLSIFALLRFFSGLWAVLGYLWRFYTREMWNRIPDDTYDGIVSSILRFLRNLGLPVDVSFWSPILSFVLVSSLALMQIRGFSDSTRAMSQGGLSAVIPSEMYALLLAYVAGIISFFFYNFFFYKMSFFIIL